MTVADVQRIWEYVVSMPAPDPSLWTGRDVAILIAQDMQRRKA